MKALIHSSLILTGLFLAGQAMAQANLELYRGNKAYRDGDIEKAEQLYKSALNKQPNRYEGNFNLGNAQYRKQDYQSAIDRFLQVANSESDPVKRAAAYHNIGNAHLQNQKIDEAIAAYKQALRLNPADNDTRYNLAYAQKLKKQEQEQQQEQDQEQDQEQENQEQEQQEQQEKEDKENSESENKEDAESDKQDQAEEQEKKEQPQNGEEKKAVNLTPREAEQLLEAAKNEDQQTLMQLKKQQGTPRQIDKDW